MIARTDAPTSAARGTETGGGQPGARTSSCSRQSAGPWLRAFSPRGPAVPLPTCYFARHWRELRGLFDRVELFNGRQLFGSVAEEGLPAVAGSDLHRAEHLPGWTTLVPCERDEEALVDYLRSRRPAFLTGLEQPTGALAA